MYYVVNITCTADLDATLEALAELGEVTQPTSTPRLRHVAKPGGETGVALATALEAVPGVCSCVDPETAAIELSLLNPHTVQQLDPNQWGQGYVSNRLDHSTYQFDATGAGVLLGNLDTPAAVDLPEFGGRASIIYDPNPQPNTQFHGTWTLALLGGAKYGMAKNATLVNLAGFNGAGSATINTLNGGFAAFADYIEANPGYRKYILSCSFSASGFLMGDPFAANINRLMALGATVVCSTGNGDGNGDGFDIGLPIGTFVWPARNPNVIAVAAHDNLEQRPNFSNFGGNTAIYAPGVAVASYDGLGNVFTGSGTSASCPIVAGSLACVGETEVEDLRQWMLDNQNPNAISGFVTGAHGSLHKPPIILGDNPPGPLPVPIELPDFVMDGNTSTPMFILDEKMASPFNVINEVF